MLDKLTGRESVTVIAGKFQIQFFLVIAVGHDKHAVRFRLLKVFRDLGLKPGNVGQEETQESVRFSFFISSNRHSALGHNFMFFPKNFPGHV